MGIMVLPIEKLSRRENYDLMEDLDAHQLPIMLKCYMFFLFLGNHRATGKQYATIFRIQHKVYLGEVG